MEETVVFIDGQYLSLISKHFGGGTPLNLDINQFAITISKSQGFWCKGVYYYTAPPYQSPNPTSEEAMRKAKYDKFVNKLKKIPNFKVREGRCQKIDNEFRQKGVDTLFIIDLTDMCNDEDTNTLILVACDTDFVPIIEKLKKHNKKIILFFYSDYQRNSKFSMSNHLFVASNRKVLITEEHLYKSLRK